MLSEILQRATLFERVTTVVYMLDRTKTDSAAIGIIV